MSDISSGMLKTMYSKVENDINEYGWSAIGVFPDTEPDTPPFTYTVGFREHDLHPELIIVGLKHEVAHQLLWTLYDRVEAGERFEDEQRVSEVVRDYDVEFRALPPDGRPLNVARNHYGVEELPALQIVWPDVEGNFPGEEACDPAMAHMQDVTRVIE